MATEFKPGDKVQLISGPTTIFKVTYIYTSRGTAGVEWINSVNGKLYHGTVLLESLKHAK